MLRFLGNRTRLCDGVTRRDLLHLGGLGAFGLGLGDWLGLAEADAATPRHPTFGRAKSCILLFPYGSPPQHETFDPKPDAPAEVRGELDPIETSVPGLRVCEGLPRIARVMDKVTVVRSMTHPYPLHGLAYAVTGMPTYTPEIEAVVRDPRHWPFLGSMVDYLDERNAPPGFVPPVPRNVALPWVVNSKVSDLGPLAGPYAAFLGQAYDPVFTDFTGKGTRTAPKLKDTQAQTFLDPYSGVGPDGHFVIAPEGQLASGLASDRVGSRRTLLAQFDDARRSAESAASSGSTSAFDRHRARALEMLTEPRFRQALDVRREPAEVRERYGLTLFGQSCLAARRLVEAGGRFVTVFWDCFGLFGTGAWDTHANHYPRLKEYLLPGFDLAYSALLNDLDERGLLDETLVLWLSEHGRTPQIDSKPPGAGRHHWSRVYSTAFAGAGIARGRVVGSSDRLGGDVKDTPVSPKDILATTFHLLGIDPDTMLSDRFARPVRAVGDGRVRPELFG
ncbi:MAG: DUF1501 domain-containing protein [Isosphaeraceae bacterium]